MQIKTVMKKYLISFNGFLVINLITWKTAGWPPPSKTELELFYFIFVEVIKKFMGSVFFLIALYVD